MDTSFIFLLAFSNISINFLAYKKKKKKITDHRNTIYFLAYSFYTGFGMRTLLAFSLAFILLVTMLQGDAVKAKRHVLGEEKALGRKGINIPAGSAASETATNTTGRSGYNNNVNNDDGDGDNRQGLASLLYMWRRSGRPS